MEKIEAVFNKLGAQWRGEQTRYRVNGMKYAEEQRKNYLEALQIIRKEIGI